MNLPARIENYALLQRRIDRYRFNIRQIAKGTPVVAWDKYDHLAISYEERIEIEALVRCYFEAKIRVLQDRMEKV